MSLKKIVKSYLLKKSKNEPTNKDLWGKIQDLVAGRKKFIIYNNKKIVGPRDGKGFLIHPSAYSNGWAAKKYKELGGGWKKEAKSKRDKGSEHGGLDAWFDKKTPWGNWIAITPVKKTVTLENGEKKTYLPGDIVGPCGISNSEEWKNITDNGKQPLKCMARPQAEKYTRKERAELAKFKRKKEKEQGKSTKVTLTPSFGEKAKKIIKKVSNLLKLSSLIITRYDESKFKKNNIKVPMEHRSEYRNYDNQEWKEKDYNYRLIMDDIFYSIIDDKVVGHLGLDDEGVIRAVYVSPEFRRRGISEKMHLEVFNIYSQVFSDDFDAMEKEEKELWEKMMKNMPNKIEKLNNCYVYRY